MRGKLLVKIVNISFSLGYFVISENVSGNYFNLTNFGGKALIKKKKEKKNDLKKREKEKRKQKTYV